MAHSFFCGFNDLRRACCAHGATCRALSQPDEAAFSDWMELARRHGRLKAKLLEEMFAWSGMIVAIAVPPFVNEQVRVGIGIAEDEDSPLSDPAGQRRVNLW